MSYCRIGHCFEMKRNSRKTVVIFASLCIAIYLVHKFYSEVVEETQVNMTIYGNVFTEMTENLTLVTAYFDLGSFKKGLTEGLHFSPEKYFKWAKAYKYIVNPLVVFTDSKEFMELVKRIRCNMARKTKIIKIDRKSLWSFKLVKRIAAVFSQPGYPKYSPNTVMPEYSAAQHAKYAVVAYAIKNKYLENEFYAWIDIGYFRDVAEIKRYSQLFAPSNIDRNKIAVNQISKQNKNLSPSFIFKNNTIWVGGGMIIGTPKVLLNFESIYKRAVEFFLDNKLMNTDQQVLYSMYSEEGRRALHPSIELQIYKPNHYSADHWFYLGYHCRGMLPKFIVPQTKECYPP